MSPIEEAAAKYRSACEEMLELEQVTKRAYKASLDAAESYSLAKKKVRDLQVELIRASGGLFYNEEKSEYEMAQP